MDRREALWLGVLVLVFLVFNIITLSPLIPWQRWLLWDSPAPDQRVDIVMSDYSFNLPAEGIQVQAGDFVEFVATSLDVTYGFGVFRPEGPIVLQMQVLPGHENRIVWRFDEAGSYDIRSTEYSGPRHSEMYLPGGLVVQP